MMSLYSLKNYKANKKLQAALFDVIWEKLFFE